MAKRSNNGSSNRGNGAWKPQPRILKKSSPPRARGTRDHSPHPPDRYYPDQLREAERHQLAERRKAAGLPSAEKEDNRLGVALSGGGIRSATFSLGLFQSLARRGLIRRIDYLSTVSGGGYFGGFLGSLFTRSRIDRESGNHEKKRAGDNRRVEEVEATLADSRSPSVRFLRENGRYLSPNGTADLWTGVAFQLRNWVTIHLTLCVLFLMVFMGADALREVLSHVGPLREILARFPLPAPHAGSRIWWSPWVWTPLLPFIFWVLPMGWAFWLTPLRFHRRNWRLGLAFWLTVGLGLIYWIALPYVPGSADQPLVYLAGLTMVIVAGFGALYYFIAQAASGNPQEFSPQETASRIRRNLTTALAEGLIVTASLWIFSVIDSLGQTVYAVVHHVGATAFLFNLKSFLALSLLVLLAGLAHQIKALLSGSLTHSWISILRTAFVWILAVSCVLFTLVAVNALGHGFAWRWKSPHGDLGRVLYEGVKASAEQQPNPAGRIESLPLGERSLPAILFFFFAFAFCGLLVGLFVNFVNLSSLQALYGARLTRAYLGASNRRRWKPEGQNVTDIIQGDQVYFHDYAPQRRGGPLHLLNITLNETVSGKSQIEWRDRKGLGLTVGPCGISVGKSDHAVWKHPPGSRVDRRTTESEMVADLRDDWFVEYLERWLPERDVVYRADSESKRGQFQIFNTVNRVETLSLGSWMSVSGAAFSTGMGPATNPAVSLLHAYFNLRLGYWWNSGIAPHSRSIRTPIGWSRKIGEGFSALFPAQSYLLDEFLGRFHGPARKYWNLSDGGHFENTGAYELIRRRLPFIVILDDGMDPAYEFADLANLVRKARLDFGAEIRFFNEDDIRRYVHHDFRSVIGTLEQLRERNLEGIPTGAAIGPHAALAWVFYPVECGKEMEFTGKYGAPASVILVVKPSLSGNETEDLLNYKSAMETFPQEPTVDQDFDEAQWESYRELGEHIGEAIFSRVSPGREMDKWLGILAKPWTETEASPNLQSNKTTDLLRSVTERMRA